MNLARTATAVKFISFKTNTLNEKGLRQLLEISYSSGVTYLKTRKGHDKNEDNRSYTSK